jgi:cysteine synthase A
MGRENMRVVADVTELIGRTPVLKLGRIVPEGAGEVYLKLEYVNPGGSIKDRIAANMIKEAEAQGKLGPGSVIVEPTSGNTGIGLAMVAASRGYRLLLVMPETMSVERRKLMAAYGAEFVLTPGSEGMKGAINKALELCKKDKNYFMPQQFENPANPEIHRKTTALEIFEQMEGKVDAVVAGVGTGGTITGIGEVLKKKIAGLEIIAVEPETSAILSGKRPGPHKIQGIGAGFVPEVLNTNIIDRIISVADNDALLTTRRLAREEGVLVGISSGAATFAALEVARQLGLGTRVLAMAPDTGERYLSSDIF